MKTFLVGLVLALVVSTSVFAGETFTLTTPVTVSNQATGGEITSYSIIPGPGPRFVINFRWTDASGNEVGVPQAVTWSGQDFLDIFGYVIQAGDAGTTLGAGLRILIHNKIEAKYGVSIE